MKKAFDKIELKGLELKNRFIRSAIWEGFATDEGFVTDKLVNFYKELSEGGVGTIITGFSNVKEYDQPAPRMMGVYDDKFIEGLKRIPEAVHRVGTKIFLQIAVGGSQGRGNSTRIVGPSEHVNPMTGNKAEELTIEEIKDLENSFALAAERAKKAGFDGVQIHGAHGYLLSQFMNPIFNRREDNYGGSIEKRARFLLETYDKIREKVGNDYPVIIKINCEDFIEGGATKEEMLWVCKELSKRKIDLIEVSGGCGASRPNEGVIRTGIKTREDEAYFLEHAKKISETVDVPVSIVGGIRNFDIAQSILENTEIQFISLARPLLCEPNLINEWEKENYNKAFCKSCNGCLGKPEGSICIFRKKQNK